MTLIVEAQKSLSATSTVRLQVQRFSAGHIRRIAAEKDDRGLGTAGMAVGELSVAKRNLLNLRIHVPMRYLLALTAVAVRQVKTTRFGPEVYITAVARWRL